MNKFTQPLLQRCFAAITFFLLTMMTTTLTAQCISFTKITTGSTSVHSLGIKTDGTLWAWGNNQFGQLGTDTSGNLGEEPQQVGTASNWVAIATGNYFSLGITADGKLWSWGRGDEDELGNGNPFGTPDTVTVPEEITSPAITWKAITACEKHSLAISTDGRLWGWGYGGFITTNGNSPSVPVQIGTDTDWVAVSTGNYHTVALKKDSTLWCWGRNGEGEAGDSTTSDNTYAPEEIDSNHSWVFISAGYDHSFAIKANGTLWSWGDNFYGELGNGTTTNGTKGPKQVGNEVWTAAAAGYDHSLAIAADGSVWGWGYNGIGQLGYETSVTLDTTLPVLIDNFYRWTSVYGGFQCSLAQTTDGSGWGWGRNEEAELGDGTNFQRYEPVNTGVPVVYPALAGTGSSKTLYQRLQADYAVDCDSLIASIAQSSDNDSIFGATTSSVWIEPVIKTDNAGKPYVQRHYEIRLPGRSGAPVGTGNITLYFTQAEFTAYNASPNVANSTYPKLPADSADLENYKANLKINWYNTVTFDNSGKQANYSGTPALLVPNAVSYVNGRWQATVTTKVFGGFFAVTGASVLPLTWLNVSASLTAQNKAQVSWQVQEQNIAMYRVERSSDGRNYSLVNTVNSKNNGTNTYSFTDAQTLTGTAFYRIQQIGKDGASSYSIVMKVSTSSGTPVVYLFPNPATDYVFVGGLQKDVICNAVITDLSGHTILTKDLSDSKNKIETGSLAKGIYIIKLIAQSGVKTVKFVKQ